MSHMKRSVYGLAGAHVKARSAARRRSLFVSAGLNGIHGKVPSEQVELDTDKTFESVSEFRDSDRTDETSAGKTCKKEKKGLWKYLTKWNRRTNVQPATRQDVDETVESDEDVDSDEDDVESDEDDTPEAAQASQNDGSSNVHCLCNKPVGQTKRTPWWCFRNSQSNKVQPDLSQPMDKAVKSPGPKRSTSRHGAKSRISYRRPNNTPLVLQDYDGEEDEDMTLEETTNATAPHSIVEGDDNILCDGVSSLPSDRGRCHGCF
ncbi:uncharacterized protein LOC119501730 [Sebastes umbrosus]|uniref:uncharacterized protein LOC119501730 n=1 Tax=Sebastes umbrosus TaxID=72105 RepID=UPI00189E2D14|nr:uncharacterized protein LOC119501730 [Sebastes umbrosus]